MRFLSVATLATRTLVVASTLVAPSLVTPGCSTAAIERRTLPSALADHVGSLPRFDHRAHVVVPESTAWNAAMRAVRDAAPVVSLNAGGSWVQTDYRYDLNAGDGLRTLTRSRYDVTFTRDARVGLVPAVAGTREQRSRTLCGEATNWAPAGGGVSLDARIRDAIGGLQDVSYESFVYAAEPAELAGRFADAMVPETSTYSVVKAVDADGTPYVDGTGRVSGRQQRDVQIEVQSRFRARFVAAPGGTRVYVEAALEHRTSDEDGERPFVADDASRVHEAVYAFLAQVAPVQDLVLPAEPWDTALDARSVEPPLPPADDDLNGSYVARLYLAASPYARPDGSGWDDFDEPPAGVIPGQGVAMPGDPRVLVQAARSFVMTSPPPSVQQFLSMLGPYASQAPNERAPELKVVIDVSGASFESSVVRESYAAIWPDSALSLSLHGDAPLAVRLVDEDGPGMVEPILDASIGARQLLTSCRPVCLEANYGAVCLSLERAP